MHRIRQEVKLPGRRRGPVSSATVPVLEAAAGRRGKSPSHRIASCLAGLTVLALPVHPVAAQESEADWTRQFGTGAPEEALAVAVDPSGDSYVVGWTAGTLPGQESAGTVDCFLRKYDRAGNEVWTRQFGSEERDFARAVVLTSAGHAYVVGETHGTLPGQSSAGGYDAFIRKYATDGAVMWTRQFGGLGGDVASGVVLDPAGNAYVVGSTAAALPGQSPAGSFDAYIRQYDTAGNEGWTRQFGSSTADVGRAVSVDRSGNLFVAGSTEGSLTDGASAGRFDAYIRLYDATGTALWTRQFGSPADDYAVAIATDPAGNPTVAGSTNGALPGQTSEGGTETFLRRFDASGAAVWTQQFGGGSADESWGVALDPAGNTYVVGTTEPYDLVQTAPAKTDCFARKYDPSGQAVWVHQFGTADTDLAFSVASMPPDSRTWPEAPKAPFPAKPHGANGTRTFSDSAFKPRRRTVQTMTAASGGQCRPYGSGRDDASGERELPAGKAAAAHAPPRQRNCPSAE